MKNSILVALLVASLGGNLWFALARSAPRAAAAADTSGRPAHPAGASARNAAAATDEKPGAPAPLVWNVRDASSDELRTLAARLRGAGFLPGVIAKIVGTMLRDRAYAKVAELPFWRLNSNNREVRKLQTEAGRELLRLQEEVLGASGSQLATLDPTQRSERYGDLPDDKVATLLKIDRDYQDMMSDIIPSGPMGPGESKALGEQFKTLEKERLADVKTALGPEAFAEYERQNSGAAMAVMRGLRDLKVTEDEYNALFAAMKAQYPNAEEPIVFTSSPEPDKLAATYAFNDQLRAVLGDERAHTYLKSADPAYRQIARFAEEQSLPAAKTYPLYQLQNEARLAVPQMAPRDGVSAPINLEKIRQTFAELNARLEALVGPEVANALRAQPGSAFRNFQPRAAPANGNAAPASAATPPRG